MDICPSTRSLTADSKDDLDTNSSIIADERRCLHFTISTEGRDWIDSKDSTSSSIPVRFNALTTITGTLEAGPSAKPERIFAAACSDPGKSPLLTTTTSANSSNPAFSA